MVVVVMVVAEVAVVNKEVVFDCHVARKYYDATSHNSPFIFIDDDLA